MTTPNPQLSLQPTASDFDGVAQPPAAPPSIGRKRPRPPDTIAVDDDGTPIAEPARLATVSHDVMTLHTSEALRLFVGQAADARWRVPPLAGGKHFASALKEIWYLSARDNPYADWHMIRAYDQLILLRGQTQKATRMHTQRLTEIRHSGLSINVMASTRPVEVSLGFRSPYGYAVAAAIVEFDYYVRVVRTLVHKDQLLPTQGQEEMAILSNTYFALFAKAMQWKRLLLHDDIKGLSRRDFVSEANGAGQQRVCAALGFLGPLPPLVLSRKQVPRHVRASRSDGRSVSSPIPIEDAFSGEGGITGDANGSAGAIGDVSRETFSDIPVAGPSVQPVSES